MDLLTQLASEEAVYSYHAFLFPFEWSYKGGDSRALLEDQTDLGQLEPILAHDRDWERRDSWTQPKSVVQYNEVVYFYEFVRNALYDSGEVDSQQRHYYFKLSRDYPNTYTIHCKEKKYELEIDDIVVSFFNTGVGYLSFSLYNKKKSQSAPQDILNINFYGRRLYPPFMGTDTSLIGQQAFFEYANWPKALNGTYESELAQDILLDLNGRMISADFDSWIAQPIPDRLPPLIHGLFSHDLHKQIGLQPVLDDRMYTLSWYGHTELASTFDMQTDWWYQFVFVDHNGPTCASDNLKQTYIQEATYTRWINYKTFYGVSRYSFVLLTEQFSHNGFSKILLSHIQTMYYKMATLALVQRACLLRFSKEVTAISQLPRKEKQINRRVASLFKQYLRFVNKIYFREVTAQDQGIELYDLLKKQMRLEGQVKELEHEIQELHQYVSMIEEDERNDQIGLLTWLGAFFIVPSFIGTYFGIGGVDWKRDWTFIAFSSIASAWLAWLYFRAIRPRKKVVLLAVLILLMLAVLGYPLWMGWKR